MLDGASRTVVGVMPRGFWFPDPNVRIWLPTPLSAGPTRTDCTPSSDVSPPVTICAQ